MLYEVRFTPEANIGLAKLAKHEPKTFAKVQRLIDELRTHLKTGIGHPEPLKGLPEGRWSRQITKKLRLVYRVLRLKLLLLSSQPMGTTTISSKYRMIITRHTIVASFFVL